MKQYEVVNDITTDTYSIPRDSGVWTEQQLENAGMTTAEIASHVAVGDLFDITFLNPPPVPPAPPVPPPPPL